MTESSKDKPFSKFIGQPKPDYEEITIASDDTDAFSEELDNKYARSYIVTGELEGLYSDPPPKSWFPKEQ